MEVLETNRAQAIFFFVCLFVFSYRHLLCIPVSSPDQNGKNVNGLGSLLFMQAAARHRETQLVGKNIIKISGHFLNLLSLQV